MSYTKIIAKPNGERARIVITDYALPGCPPSVGVDVFKQQPDGINWVKCTQEPEDRKAAMAMSVDDYVKHGRHPMFSEVTHADLLKAGAEAKHFNYRNPYIEATLHVTNTDGDKATVPVIVDTADGMLINHEVFECLKNPDDGTDSAQKVGYLQVGKKQFEVETNRFQQCRVVDLPVLQQLVARQQLNPKLEAAEACNGPS
jgi:hypothetical protein